MATVAALILPRLSRLIESARTVRLPPFPLPSAVLNNPAPLVILKNPVVISTLPALPIPVGSTELEMLLGNLRPTPSIEIWRC
jgi:hypothetical protein